MSFNKLGLAKGLAITSLGLYAGILSSQTAIQILTPIGTLKNGIRHFFCVFGVATSALATLSTLGFGFAYYFASNVQEAQYLLCGLAIGPLSSGYLMAVSSLINKYQEKINDSPNLPPHHPSVKNSNGEIQQCPFAKGQQQSASVPVNSDEKVATQPVQSASSSSSCLSPLFGAKRLTSMNTHLVVASCISVATFAQTVFGSV